MIGLGVIGLSGSGCLFGRIGLEGARLALIWLAGDNDVGLILLGFIGVGSGQSDSVSCSVVSPKSSSEPVSDASDKTSEKISFLFSFLTGIWAGVIAGVGAELTGAGLTAVDFAG